MARIVFGTYALADTPLAGQLLDRFYASGGRALDVANVYRDGEASHAVGKWLRARSEPDGVVIYAKGCHPPHCAPDEVAAEIDTSRRLLGVDRLDVFLLHRDEGTRPVAEWTDALLGQVQAGTIGGFGVSNWTVPRVRELQAHADQRLVFSNHFSLAEMVEPPWPDCLAVSKEELHGLSDVTFIAWSSLATGYFSGHDTPCWDSPGNRARRERAAALAAELGTSAAAIALAYVLHQPEYVLAAVGTNSEAHVDEAFAAARLELTPEQLAWLERG